MKRLIAFVMSFTLLAGCATGTAQGTLQTAHTIDQASVAALNAFCQVAESQADEELGKVCGSVLGTVNQTQAAIDTALAFITAVLAKRAQAKAYEPEALRQATVQMDKDALDRLAGCPNQVPIPHGH